MSMQYIELEGLQVCLGWQTGRRLRLYHTFPFLFPYEYGDKPNVFI